MSMSVKLTPATSTFSSPVSSYSVQNNKYFEGKNKTPYIETLSFTLNGKKNAFYGKRKMSGERTFETFNINGDVLKVVRNKFGEVLKSKSSSLILLGDVNRAYNRAANSMFENMKSVSKLPLADFIRRI